MTMETMNEAREMKAAEQGNWTKVMHYKWVANALASNNQSDDILTLPYTEVK